MNTRPQRIRHLRAAFVAVLSAATVTTACAPAHQPQPVSSATETTATHFTGPSPAGSSAPAAGPERSGRHSGRASTSTGTSGAAAGQLPADWPADVPLPAGSIQGSTGSAGRWTVLILTEGPAATVHQSTIAFYTAAGFTAGTNSILTKGNRHITFVAENRDHSATQTNLIIGVTTN